MPIVALSTILIGGFLAIMVYTTSMHRQQVHAYVGDYFVIPSESKHIALLGCTPHPTEYIKKNNNSRQLLHTIKLADFLDIDYVRDSFKKTFSLCKEHDVDHLVIAYLPIYYSGMRKLLGEHFVDGCRIFFKRIIQEIIAIIEQSIVDTEFTGDVTLIIPPDYQLARVPQEISGIDERIRYLIKQFPVLKNISGSSLETITIINNRASREDDRLIDYLQYEYLYEKRIAFKKSDTGKERFHAEKITDNTLVLKEHI